MKNYVKKFICGIMCLCLSIVSCFAVTKKNYFWGSEYYMQANEISGFRKQLETIFKNNQDFNNWLTGGAALIAASTGVGIAVGIGGAAFTFAQKTAMDFLLADLERRSHAGRAIVVSIPHVIQGWNIREQ